MILFFAIPFIIKLILKMIKEESSQIKKSFHRLKNLYSAVIYCVANEELFNYSLKRKMIFITNFISSQK